MKYCKKCFRNVREDVNVCPYCGAPGLEEYGSSKSGEAFTCSQPQQTEREIEKEINKLTPDDAYSTEKHEPFSIFEDNEETDAYGNIKKQSSDCIETEYDAYGSKSHSDDCLNAPDEPQTLTQTYQSSDGKTTFSKTTVNENDPQMRIEYLRMLKNIDGISQERIDELMRRYDETHSSTSSKTVYTRTFTNFDSKSNTQGNTGAIIGVIFGIIFGFASPFFGIIILNIMRKKMSFADENTRKTALKLINVFTVVFVIILIVQFMAVGGITFANIAGEGVFNV